MSTIKSSDEHLTLNADGTSKDIKFQANGVEKASISSAGAFTSTTIDATKLTGTIPNFTSTGIDDNADANAITIDSSERVGIGTGSPTRKLHIVDNSNYSLSVTKSGENIHMAQFASDGTASLGIAVDDNNNLVRLNSEGSNDSLQLEVADGTVGVKIDSTGAVTIPNQPAFCVLLSANQNNLALYGRRKVEFDTERFDQNADFNTSTNEFTAPVTGKYSLHFSCEISDYQGDANFYGWHIETSNEVYLTYEHVGGGASDNSGGGAISVIADMDAGDTAFASIYQHAGSATSDVVSSGTHFSGALIC